MLHVPTVLDVSVSGYKCNINVFIAALFIILLLIKPVFASVLLLIIIIKRQQQRATVTSTHKTPATFELHSCAGMNGEFLTALFTGQLITD